MGQQRLSTPKANNDGAPSRAPKNKQPSARRGEAIRAHRRINDDIQTRSSQHITDIPVNKSIYNGIGGDQSRVTAKTKITRDATAVRIIPLGGLGEMGIGKNMTAIEYGDDIIVIDMGLLFSGADYPGVNYMTPNIDYLKKNKHKIKAHLFTHAHLDHIGGFKDIVHHIPAPVYGTTFTIGMIKRQMSESTSGFEPDYHEVDPFSHERIQLGAHLSFEFVHVLHSIPGCVAIVIRTPNGVIVHMGDWRFEDKPLGAPFDIPRLLEISQKEGIELLLNESTNIDSGSTRTHGEHEIAESIGHIMDRYTKNRLVISCFSSQIHRLQLILDEAKQHGRKVAFAGFSMIGNVETALKTREIKIPNDTIVKMEDLVKLPDDKVTILCTGSQGELNAVLNRMASGAHRHIKIKKQDVIVFSSSPIPGNEPRVAQTVDGLMREGAEIIQHGKTHIHGFSPLHLSGHAFYEDHVKLVTTLNPRNYLPVHGEFHMLVHNAEMAENIAGIKRENILVADSGDIIELSQAKQIRKNGRIKVGSILHDDNGAQVHETVIKDRLHVGNEGIVMIVLVIDKKTGKLLKNPDIVSRAFIYMRESEELAGTIRQYLRQKIAKDYRRQKDMKLFKKELRDDLAHTLFSATKRSPVIVPVINEV